MIVFGPLPLTCAQRLSRHVPPSHEGKARSVAGFSV
uniref:Uncharacterized protein n=1 Tax=Anguilla anguilla TaxID=7936 RepID=A0A0E9SMN2_ANGAN